ncbi:unannotated protein [freshwater metagenome]|uniref:Unannotated protein n=1 Tax=freshwater metagenome TaxID=449393 RepID=A0A6J7UJV0_9ZZZZ
MRGLASEQSSARPRGPSSSCGRLPRGTSVLANERHRQCAEALSITFPRHRFARHRPRFWSHRESDPAEMPLACSESARPLDRTSHQGIRPRRRLVLPTAPHPPHVTTDDHRTSARPRWELPALAHTQLQAPQGVANRSGLLSEVDPMRMGVCYPTGRPSEISVLTLLLLVHHR